MLGAGLAPGVSSALARIAVDRVNGSVDRVSSNVLLSIGDTFGEASRSYILQEIAQAYPVFVDGRERRVLPFANSHRSCFRRRWGCAPLTCSRSLTRCSSRRLSAPARHWQGWRSIRRGSRPRLPCSCACAGPPYWRVAAAIVVPLNGSTRWLQGKYAGRDWYGLMVEVEGPGGSARASLAGHGQADVAALGAAAIARAIVDGQVSEPGIWLAEQVVPPGPFLQHLAANGVVPKVEAVLAVACTCGCAAGGCAWPRSPDEPAWRSIRFGDLDGVLMRRDR